MNKDRILSAIRNRQIRIDFVGLGYVDSPLAVEKVKVRF